MTDTIDYGFNIGQQVTITEPNLKARITAVLNNSDGIQYQVVYWDETVRREVWVHAVEIKSTQKQNTLIKST
jgi:hypothetical protein